MATIAVRLNINTATLQDLLTKLSHCKTGRGRAIGPKIAERIIKHRQEKGRFKYIHDLLKVDMIGQKTLQSIQDYICI
jgi:competence ComEA-like helix-hairpin-helix protein